MKLICIGRNYVAHALELNNEVPDEPLVFMKPESALNASGVVHIPSFTEDMHYELELVVRICRKAKNISKAEAGQYIDGIGLGFDFTARDVQQKCKEKGHPWEKAKAFDGSATVSEMKDYKSMSESTISFHLIKNGQLAQEVNSRLMIHGIEELVAYVSSFFTLNPGDLIYTGTPAGVGPVRSGDRLEAYMQGELLHKVRIN